MEFRPGDLRPTGRGQEVEVVAPTHCGNGHNLGAGKTHVSFSPCHCDDRGHTTWSCRECGHVTYGRPCERLAP